MFSPKELDFGIVSSASGAVTQTITVSNLTQQAQTFASALDASSKTSLPYTIAEAASDCTSVGSGMKTLAAGAACHITLGLTASNSAANDGPIHANWLIGTRDVQLTAYGQAAQLSVSSAEVDFGTQYTGGLKLPRYLYLSNSSAVAAMHAAVNLPSGSPFTVNDGCPRVLEPQTVCQLQLGYQSAQTPSSDSVTLTLDQGLTTLLTGITLPQPSANGASVNPNLSVSAETVNFATPVAVTGVSASTQTLTITNLGASPFSLVLALTGDFAQTTNCAASLAGHSSCNVVLSFAPSQPGERQGLLAVTAGAGTTPQYVALSGTGTGILSPANNGTIGFGGVIVGQPSVMWVKVTQPFTSFSAAATGAAFGVVRVEDIGYGHGQPAIAAFGSSASGSCLNCWLGIVFTPSLAGPQSGTLTLTSAAGGSPYVLTLTGTGLAQTGLLMTPATQDFGPVPLHSSSGPQTFVVANLVAGGSPITLTTPAVTGDFAVSHAATGGAPCGGALAYTASCLIAVAFTPTVTGARVGTLTVQAGSTTAAAALSGYGSGDPGVALSPTGLTFDNVPGTSATQQTVTITNTSGSSEQIGTVSATTAGGGASSFGAASSCGALAPASSCMATVTFIPASGPVSGVLTIPVTSMTSGGDVEVTNLTVPLIGAYAAQGAALQIVPNAVQFGPQATGSAGVTRQFTINNLTASTLTLSVALPGAVCPERRALHHSLAANGSCSFSATFLPITNGDITGTIAAQGVPSGGLAAVNGLGYVEGYGLGSGMLAITGGLQPGTVLGFGQVPSGQSATRTLTLTNAASSTPLTVRRVTSQWPFLSTTTCGAAMAPGASCTVTLNYTPINQAATGSSPPPVSTDTGTLIVESDAVSGPDLVNLTGTSTPVLVGSPSNTAPVVSLSTTPSSVTFADTTVGSASAPQPVAVTNTGNATITVSGVQSSTDFPASTNCGTLIAGASCAISVVFTPQPGNGAGLRTGAVEISSNAGTSLELVSVAGVSDQATLSVTPGTLVFGTVLVGASATLPVQLANGGTTSASLNSYSATGDYSVTAGTCPQPGGTLAAGASCTLQVTFGPSQAGTRTGALSIASSVAPLPLGVALTGTGAQPQLQITPDGLAFGSVSIGSSANLSVTLLNTGTTPITGIALAITGDYSIASPCGTTALAGGASCSITIQFAPTAAGARTGMLTVTSSDPGSPATLTINGTGVAAGSFTLTVNGGSTGSATVVSGSPATYNLAVTPTNGFTGTVVLNCTPVTAAQYATCSLLPSSVMLAGGVQNSTATINTVTTLAETQHGPMRRGRGFNDAALAFLFPAFAFVWRARAWRQHAWSRAMPVLWAACAAAVLLTSSGCGGRASNANTTGPTNLLYTPAGNYQYQVTASRTSGGNPITQTVTLNLTVQ